MAVYKRSYSSYEGPVTPRWQRFLILTRYSARGIFQSRLLIALFAMCFFFPLVLIAGLYLNHNASMLKLIRLNSDHFMDVNGTLFMTLMAAQSSLAFIVTAFIGPGLIAPDLANNALPLYFCRPLTRSEYVLGRALVIVGVLSCITLGPGLLVFGIETTLSGWSWGWEHREFAGGVVVGSLMWIAVLTLLALSLSAWVRWKVVAGGLLLGVMFITSGVAAAMKGILDTDAGFYLDPAALVMAVFANFFGVDVKTGITTSGACMALLAICAFCVYLLSRKIRAFEVIR